ncbi:hypothetical protein LOTGIDRAFT_175972 [Lottia gigantea]|uniref:protein-tyrosine-phosphatase n=1 Tax=Lottia gigantea TaxID=225164 RepID=V4A0V0_LOTGI|nr:hypothetical protein LOTGIDRAFT_175972 [Lottia gigantea]ESO86891.1 hypothetical protein LOTGIDRAFT_175972 [Lottia gigantea]
MSYGAGIWGMVGHKKLNSVQNRASDCSRPYSLPTVCGKHKDLKSISPQTVEDLLNGKYPTIDNNYMILDCRYPYEYDGGHIQGARAPTLLRYLRSQDRLLNSDNYPSLYYPEVYILDGGYKDFYERTQNLCEPCDYIQMLDPLFTEELSIFQSKKSRGNRSREEKTRKPRVIRF